MNLLIKSFKGSNSVKVLSGIKIISFFFSHDEAVENGLVLSTFLSGAAALYAVTMEGPVYIINRYIIRRTYTTAFKHSLIDCA